MWVKNINGTSQNTCKCGSWLEHWSRFSQDSRVICSVLGCRSVAEVGAHVQLFLSTDERWYIIPVCQMHNMVQSTPLAIDDSYRLVSANVNKTCG